MLQPAPLSLSEEFRHRLAAGRPSDAVLEGWGRIEASIASEPEALLAVLQEAAQLDQSHAAAAVISASAVGAAVVSASGEVLHADPAFLEWFGSPRESLAFRRLIKLALKGPPASGLVEAVDGCAVAACAALREAAGGWPLSPQARAALARPGKRIVLLGFAPSRDSELTARAAQAFGLTPLEARLAEALIDAPNLHTAAERIGVGRETAREALKKAMRKAGARRSPDLVRRMMDLMCGAHAPAPDVEEVLASVFGATPAEARAAARFAEGMTAGEVAASLGVKEATVRGQLKAVFAKTGVSKAKDLVRLTIETSSLSMLTKVSETVLEPHDPHGRLRIVPTAGERRIAFLDYGPRGGRPLVVFHGLGTGRTLPARLVLLMQQAGWRPIVPQRPGFGLTDIAPGDHLDAAADDLAAVLDVLKLRKADVLARDGSVAAALAFAARHPERVGRGTLFNPRLPDPHRRLAWTMMGALSRMLAARPDLIVAFSEMLRRQTRTDLLKHIIRQSLRDVEHDRHVLEMPGVLDQLVRDAQGAVARTSAGFAAEQRVYALGWTIPATVGGHPWTVVELEGLGETGGLEAWGHLPGVTRATLAGAGLLAHFSHPAEIVELLGEP